MTIKVSQVEREARDQCPAFTEQSTTPPVLRRQLLRKAQSLLERAVGINPDAFLCSIYELELPLVDFEAGEPLPPHVYIEGGKVSPTDETLHLVRHRVLADPPFWPAAAVVAGRLYLGRTESWWSSIEKLTCLYVPQIDPLHDSRQDFDPLPDSALDVLVAEGALIMARRAKAHGGAVDVLEFYEDRKGAVQTFLRTVGGLRRATTGKMTPMRY